MKTRIGLVTLLAFFGLAAVAFAAFNHFNVVPSEFEPEGTPLVNAAWLNGIGCPTNAATADAPPPDFEIEPGAPFTDPACLTGDPKDKNVEGLLLAKTGPTANVAAAQAHINGVRGETLTELGYDIRKAGGAGDDRGSHCGAGAPRFNVVTMDDVTHFLGCNSPPATSQVIGMGWTRLRWNAAGLAAAFPPISSTDQVKAIEIVFDEGQDAGPDNFGLAVLDNIDINGVLIGHAPTNSN